MSLTAVIRYFFAPALTREKINSYTLLLTFMEPCIARCVFYVTNDMQLTQCSLLLSLLLSPNPSTPAVDSRKARQ